MITKGGYESQLDVGISVVSDSSAGEMRKVVQIDGPPRAKMWQYESKMNSENSLSYQHHRIHYAGNQNIAECQNNRRMGLDLLFWACVLISHYCITN